MSTERHWRLTVSYGPDRLEVGAVEAYCTEDVADEVAKIMLAAGQAECRKRGLPYGVSIVMGCKRLPVSSGAE